MRWKALVSLLVLSGMSGPSAAQIPEAFTNLQVFDQEIERAELVGIMRSWTGHLGVRCTHCHVGPDNLVGMDFATDEKATKRTARAMFSMARDINRTLAKLPVHEEAERGAAAQVTCYTCHRAQPIPPQSTRDLLAEVFADAGAEAAVERFEELREQHSEAGRYDLRSVALFQLGRSLLEQSKVEDAKTVIRAMLELFPTMADGYVLLGQAHLMDGDLEAAEAEIGRARAIEPDNRFSRWLEGQLRMRKSAEEAADG